MRQEGTSASDAQGAGAGQGFSLWPAGLALSPVAFTMNMKATDSIISKAFSASIFSHYRDLAACQGP